MPRKFRPDLPASRHAGTVQLIAVAGMPEIRRGDDLARVITAATSRQGLAFADGDILVIAQKIVSKAEGRTVRLAKIRPSAEARELAKTLRNDPRFIEIILRGTRRIVRKSERVLIVETHHGFVCANAGVDRSNVPGRDCVTLLPRKPDVSARRLVSALKKRTGKRIAVIISDTFGRAWRLGLVNVAIGAAGLPVLLDLRGSRDRTGKRLHATILAVADELAAAGGLLMGKTTGIPVVVVRGYKFRETREPAAKIIRPAHEDLFR